MNKEVTKVKVQVEEARPGVEEANPTVAEVVVNNNLAVKVVISHSVNTNLK